MNVCGAADIIAKMYGDNDDEAIITQPVYLGGPFVMMFFFADSMIGCYLNTCMFSSLIHGALLLVKPTVRLPHE